MTHYKKYSDEDVLEAYNTNMDYSGKIEGDLAEEILNRGGIETLKSTIKTKNQFPDEINRISKEVRILYSEGRSFEEIKNSITSDILPTDLAGEVIRKQIANTIAEIKDKSITSRTIIGSIIGTLIASVVCGIIWGLSIIYSGKMYFILIPGLVFISYIILRLITKQSRNNTLVFIATFLSTFLAIIFGIVLYKIA